MKPKIKALLPVILLFLALNALFIAGRPLLERMGADQGVLIAGNLFLFTITLLSFLLASRGLKNPNPHAFVRSVYGSILLKLMLCMTAALAYIALFRAQLNKPALFTLMGLYLVYTFMEVSVLLKKLKSNPHA